MIVYFEEYKVIFCETRILWHIMANISALAENFLGSSAPFWICLFLGQPHISYVYIDPLKFAHSDP